MKIPLYAALALLAVFIPGLHAESADESWDIPDESYDRPAETADNHAGEKLKAIGISLGATVLPTLAAVAVSSVSDPGENIRLIATLGMSGLLVGPSVGQFYADSPLLGLLGVGVRTVGATTVVLGIASALGNVVCGFRQVDDPGSDECDDSGDGEAVIRAGLWIYGAGTLFSLAAIPWAVDRKHRRKRLSAWEWTPTLALSSGGDFRPGAMASLRF